MMREKSIGRGAGMNIIMKDTKLSRNHCFVKIGGKYE